MPLNPPETAGRIRPVVLVVDDDPGLCESFRLILDDHCDVLDVADGASALDTLRSCQVDLVLLDIRLPGHRRDWRSAPWTGRWCTSAPSWRMEHDF